MFQSMWQVAVIWLVSVVAMLIVAALAKGKFLRTMGSTAAIVASIVPALCLMWGLIQYAVGTASIYYGERPSLLDLEPSAWAIAVIPWITTLLGILLLVRRPGGLPIGPGG